MTTPQSPNATIYTMYQNWHWKATWGSSVEEEPATCQAESCCFCPLAIVRPLCTSVMQVQLVASSGAGCQAGLLCHFIFRARFPSQVRLGSSQTGSSNPFLSHLMKFACVKQAAASYRSPASGLMLWQIWTWPQSHQVSPFCSDLIYLKNKTKQNETPSP